MAILLVAFFLNLFGMLGSRARLYQALNAIGAGLACWASYLIGFMSFVVLEVPGGARGNGSMAARQRRLRHPRFSE